jgi:K(+)-stimulated pyrophosphate-energized sodium pump
MAIVATLIVGFVGGIEALGGYLAGSIFSSLLLALLMANAGGLWDNAKKLIESGKYGGKGSDAHKAAVVGDTVGDPFKDTAGPSLNTMITVMSLVAMLFAALIVQYNLLSILGL